jgi:hypothetical protein
VNRKGHPATLRASQPGNCNALTHGAFSRRTLEPHAREIADALLELPYAVPLDRLAAEEIGSVVVLLERIDEELLANGLTDRRGNARSLLELQGRLSGRLERWLKQFGATPAARAQWLSALHGSESLAQVVRREIAEGTRLVEAARDRGDLTPSSPEESQRDT